jgi:hypothetical protein
VHPPDGFSDDEVSTIETIVRNYNHYHTALTTVYGFLFGSYTLDDFKYSQSKSLAILLLYLFLFFVVIIMLNLLIAIMADKYAEVQGHARAEAMYAKAMIVLEYEKKFLKSLMKQNSNQQSKKSCSWYFAWICSFQCGPFMPNPLNNQQLQVCFPRWVHVLKKEVEGGSSISSDQNSLGISLDGDAGIGEDDDRVGWVGQMTAISINKINGEKFSDPKPTYPLNYECKSDHTIIPTGFTLSKIKIAIQSGLGIVGWQLFWSAS